MTMFSPGDRSEKIGMRLDSLIVAESWGEIWRATHDTLSGVLVVAYKREEGKNLFLAAREGLDAWKRLAESGTRGILKIHKIVSSGKIPMLIVEDPGGETAREFFESEAATLKKTARMVRACARTLQTLQAERLVPVGITPDTIIRKEGKEDYPSFLIPVSPGVFGDAVRLGDGRYISPDALLLGDREHVNADVYSLAWIWAELLARDHKIDHQTRRLRDHVHYPRLREIIHKALVFREDHYMDAGKLEFEADQWLENDAASDREAFDEWAEKERRTRRKRRRARRKKKRTAERRGGVSSAEAAGRDRGESGPADAGGSDDEFGPDVSPRGEEDEDDLAFARDIPPLGEPAARSEVADSGSERAGGEAEPVAAADERPDSTSNFFPLLLTGCFVFVIVGAFSMGIWLLIGDGDSDTSGPIEVAETTDAASEDAAAEDAVEEVSGDGTPTPTGTPGGDEAVEPAGSAVSESVGGAPASTPRPAPNSVQGLLNAFRAANQRRDMAAIRNLYLEEREFEAVRGVLGTLGSDDRELATLNFIPRSGPPPPEEGIQGIGTLRVTTSAFNLEIPVGRRGEEFFLTSVGRVGELWPAAPTPEPTDEPLEYRSWARGEWPADIRQGRVFRIGLGDKARAAVVLERSTASAEPLTLTSTLSNPNPEKMYYQYVIEVMDAEDRLITIGSGGGALDPGTEKVAESGRIFAPDAALEGAAAFEARWYESNVPLGLVGGGVIKNPRIPVGIRRAFTFQLGEGKEGEGLIFTDYIDNQKVIAAPVLLRNQTDQPMNAVCAVGFYDADGMFISGRSARAEVKPESEDPFADLVCVLPQGAYGNVVAFQSVLYVDGVEFGRTGGELPEVEEVEDVVSLAAPTPERTPSPTPTPLPASAAPESTDYRSPAEDMTVEEALAMMEPAERPDNGAATPQGDWTDAGEGEGDVAEGEAVPTPLPDEQVEQMGRIASGLGAVWSILSVVFVFGYFIAAFCFQKIMEKSGKKDLALVAWIPLINWVAVPWLISGRSIMFPILVVIIPCLGIFFYIAMWYDVCVARNKSGIWAFVVTFIPILGVPYLAFSE